MTRVAGQAAHGRRDHDEATDPARDKPALYLDGGIHAGELTSSAVATRRVGHLLNGFGRDACVTALLDALAFYVRPEFHPDGSDLTLVHDQFLCGQRPAWEQCRGY